MSRTFNAPPDSPLRGAAGSSVAVGGECRHAAGAPRRSLVRWALLGVVVCCTGCMSLAPRYETPELPVPDDWLDARSGVAAADLAWNQYFSDPMLQQLIRTALEHNRDLRVAMLRVEEARAMHRIQRADLFPQINAAAQGTRARVPGDLSPSGTALISSDYRAELGVSNWELDLWGRVRSLNESALQQWLATQAGSHAARTALIAQVADAYLSLRDLGERVALAQRAVETRRESLRIFTRRFEVGSASRLELTQVQVLLSQAQTLLSQLEQARDAQIQALGPLIGGHPGELQQAAPFDDTMTLADLAPGLSSALLTARPDIAAAEYRLRAANANIGAARAAFFPRIALTGSWGTASTELDGLFESGSGAWAFAPAVSLPIFDAGRRRANLAASQVRRDIAVAEYEKSIQVAFREVADALSARRWLAEQLELQRQTLGAARERSRLAQLRYDSGSAAYLEVLDAQRELLTAEQQLVQARRALLSNQVALYAALGGDSRASASVAAPVTSP